MRWWLWLDGRWGFWVVAIVIEMWDMWLRCCALVVVVLQSGCREAIYTCTIA